MNRPDTPPADPKPFDAPWQAQAFALVVALHERGVFTWAEWAETLGAAVNRVDAAKLAVERANSLAGDDERARGAVAASDAFFPFADGFEMLAEAGVRAVVQPGGSIRDAEVIEAANKAGVTMYLTGARHFAH